MTIKVSKVGTDWRKFDPAMEWLRRALKDVGYAVGGWGWGFNSDGRPWCMDIAPYPGDKEQVAALRKTVQGLWDNERPGFKLQFEIRP